MEGHCIFTINILQYCYEMDDCSNRNGEQKTLEYLGVQKTVCCQERQVPNESILWAVHN